MLTRFAVVVPAHNEQELLPACLTALAAAAARVHPLPVEIIVVADSCSDDTAGVARGEGAEVITVDCRNVGRARAAGMDHALRTGTAGLWLATTDADSCPPPGWLRRQAAHAGRGAQLMVGTVEVQRWGPWSESVREHYEAAYRAGLTATGHDHVHGANLGIAAATYRQAGGFAPLAHDEDRDLVTRAVALGATVVRDRSRPVITSARAAGRAPAGFAGFLAALAESEKD